MVSTDPTSSQAAMMIDYETTVAEETLTETEVKKVEEPYEPAEKNSRLRSKVWDHAKRITLPSGETKAECPHCKRLYKMSKTGSTTTLKRHLESCKKRARTEKGQKEINLEPIAEDEKEITVTNYKYDRDKVKKVLAKLIIVDEKPFRFVQSKLFNLYSKTLQPRHEKWSRHAIRRECIKHYEEERANLKVELAVVHLVCLTTDCWTSRRTKQYMSLTAHYVSKDWKPHVLFLVQPCNHLQESLEL